MQSTRARDLIVLAGVLGTGFGGEPIILRPNPWHDMESLYSCKPNNRRYRSRTTKTPKKIKSKRKAQKIARKTHRK